MTNPEIFSDEAIALDLTALDIRSVGRRQFIGSLLALFVICLATSLTALKPVHHDSGAVGPHRFALMQPIFIDQAAQRIASVKPHEIELP
jgi:hypothetical protein